MNNIVNVSEGRITLYSTISKMEIVQIEGGREVSRTPDFYSDYAELMAEDGIAMSMQDWLNETDKFLKNNRQRVLPDKGRVSNEDALKKADEIYKQFRVKQDNDYISSFDRNMVKYLKGKHNE